MSKKSDDAGTVEALEAAEADPSRPMSTVTPGKHADAKNDESGKGAAADSRSPEEIRRDIEDTREEMGDTVEALAEKTDVKGQAKQRITEVKEAAQRKKDEFKTKAQEATPDSAAGGAQSVKARIQENPTVAIVAASFLLGLLFGRRLGR